MSQVTEIHPWIIHLETIQDEFAAKCGADYPGMLVADKQKTGRWLLIGYKICADCQKATDPHPL